MVWPDTGKDFGVGLPGKGAVFDKAFGEKGRTAFHRLAAIEPVQDLDGLAATALHILPINPELADQAGDALAATLPLAKPRIKDLADAARTEDLRMAGATGQASSIGRVIDDHRGILPVGRHQGFCPEVASVEDA